MKILVQTTKPAIADHWAGVMNQSRNRKVAESYRNLPIAAPIFWLRSNVALLFFGL